MKTRAGGRRAAARTSTISRLDIAVENFPCEAGRAAAFTSFSLWAEKNAAQSFFALPIHDERCGLEPCPARWTKSSELFQLCQLTIDPPPPLGQIQNFGIVSHCTVLRIVDTLEKLDPTHGRGLDLPVQNRGEDIQFGIVPMGQSAALSESLERASKEVALENVYRDVRCWEILDEVAGHSDDPRAQFS